MSKLEELIQELCPDGVGYKSIGDCVQKTSNIKWATTEGSYLYIDLTSVDRATHKITETQTVNANNAPSRAQQIVLEGDVLFATTRPTLKRFCLIDDKYDGQVCSTGFCVLRAKENLVIPQWLFHIVSCSEFYYYIEANQQGTSYPAISDKMVKQFKIPVPPLPVQREIVRILDNFTELTTELTAELTTELTARKKQYEYYKRQLLDNFDTETVPFNKVCNNVLSGRNKVRLVDGKYPVYGSTGIISTTNTPAYSKEQILIARVGANAGFVHIANGVYDVSDNTLIVDLKDGVSLKYIYYKLSSMNLHQYAKGGGQPLVTAGQIKELKITIPTLERQLEIVSILDRFDVLCNDLVSRLLAEIEARQKRYEYYRDKLLTFKETNI